MMRFTYFLTTAAALTALSTCALAIGFDPRGAQEAAGLSREFDDETRLRQMQEAPPPLVDVKEPIPVERPTPARRASQGDADPTPLVQATQPRFDPQATRSLQEAERQLQRERQNGWWYTVWRFALWMGIGVAGTWGVWTWMLRRASQGIRTS